MEENLPSASRDSTEVMELLFNDQSVNFDEMDETKKEKIYNFLTLNYQQTGAIKSDNSIDLNSLFGFDVMGVRVWPANSFMLEFIKKYGSCFPIRGETPKETIKLLIDRMERKRQSDRSSENVNNEVAK